MPQKMLLIRIRAAVNLSSSNGAGSSAMLLKFNLLPFTVDGRLRQYEKPA